jgi:hypothetical protein
MKDLELEKKGKQLEELEGEIYGEVSIEPDFSPKVIKSTLRVLKPILPLFNQEASEDNFSKKLETVLTALRDAVDMERLPEQFMLEMPTNDMELNSVAARLNALQGSSLKSFKKFLAEPKDEEMVEPDLEVEPEPEKPKVSRLESLIMKGA